MILDLLLNTIKAHVHLGLQSQAIAALGWSEEQKEELSELIRSWYDMREDTESFRVLGKLSEGALKALLSHEVKADLEDSRSEVVNKDDCHPAREDGEEAQAFRPLSLSKTMFSSLAQIGGVPGRSWMIIVVNYVFKKVTILSMTRKHTLSLSAFFRSP